MKYKVVCLKNPSTREKKYYPVSVSPEPMLIDEITAEMEKQCALTSADIKAAVDAMEYVVGTALRAGRSVRFGDLGTFRTTVNPKAGGRDAASEVTEQDIESLRVQFSASPTLRPRLDVKTIPWQQQKPDAGE